MPLERERHIVFKCSSAREDLYHQSRTVPSLKTTHSCIFYMRGFLADQGGPFSFLCTKTQALLASARFFHYLCYMKIEGFSV